MTTTQIWEYLQQDIHSAVFATVDERGLPQTCVIDLMLVDEKGLYFLTAKGKKFHDRLVKRSYVAVSGMKGQDTRSTVAISLRGKVKSIGQEKLDEIFEKNPYMAAIYPNPGSRSALEVFCIYEAEGEYFDLGQDPVYRQNFAYGGAKIGGNSMNQSERRQILIRSLLKERPEYRKIEIPHNGNEQKKLLRSLMNIRMAAPVSGEFERIQDEYLQEENRDRGIVELSALTPVQNEIYLWRGDITRIACGAIVNAANSGMTGCYQPCHNCIDNCIHTYAGIQLRNYCNDLMEKQGYAEPTGTAKITPAFNLPCRYVIHTVGPIVQGKLLPIHCRQLASCYRSCLELADQNQVHSIAFCCISTGVFMFPNEEAAEIAVQTVKDYKAETGSKIEVIFNVFKEIDEQIYRKLLG